MNDYQEKYKLSKQIIEDGNVKESIEMEFPAQFLGEMLDRYDRFLRASGFVYNGTVEIYNRNENM